MGYCGDERLSKVEGTFRCRRCRLHLFSANHLQVHDDVHDVGHVTSTGVHIDLTFYAKCSSWFLQDDEMLPWIQKGVDEAKWTEGKLYCPKCRSRIGAFDYIHGVNCNCGHFIIPAVWIQKNRVDYILPENSKQNLDIRKPAEPARDVIPVSQSPEITGGERAMDILSECHTRAPNSEPTTDEIQASVDDRCGAHLCANSFQKAASNDCKALSAECEDVSVHVRQQCGLDVHWSQSRQTEEIHHAINQSLKSCTCSPLDEVPKENSLLAMGRCGTPLRETRLGLDEEMGSVLRSKRRRKVRRGTFDLTAHDWDREGRQVIQTDQGHSNSFSCLSVNEDTKEQSSNSGLTAMNKAQIPEFLDHHTCPVCLDLLYEPFKCSCGHVFCDPCLRQLNFRNSGRTLKCPLCRRIVEHVSPVTDLKNEIIKSYDSCVLKKREKIERRAPYRKWPLPTGCSRSQRNVSRAQRHVTLPCVVFTFLVCAIVYSTVMFVILSYLMS